jgi:hypothetical protein
VEYLCGLRAKLTANCEAFTEEVERRRCGGDRIGDDPLEDLRARASTLVPVARRSVMNRQLRLRLWFGRWCFDAGGT